MATKKIRVYELARELGVENAVVLDLANELKIGVKSHSSSIDDPSADRVRRLADSKGLRKEPVVEEPQPPPPPPPGPPSAPASGPSGGGAPRYRGGTVRPARGGPGGGRRSRLPGSCSGWSSGRPPGWSSRVPGPGRSRSQGQRPRRKKRRR